MFDTYKFCHVSLRNNNSSFYGYGRIWFCLKLMFEILYQVFHMKGLYWPFFFLVSSLSLSFRYMLGFWKFRTFFSFCECWRVFFGLLSFAIVWLRVSLSIVEKWNIFYLVIEKFSFTFFNFWLKMKDDRIVLDLLVLARFGVLT
jgi:hypothetical protein